MIVNTNYCLKSNLPYLVFRVLLLSLLLFAAVGSISTRAVEAAGNTYYVAKTGNNNNPGTLAQPWLTIQKAASTMVAGDTVYIRAGTYNEQVTPANSGSAGSPVTYQNYASESVILDGTSKSTSSSGLFKIQNKNYITLSGIQIQNSDYAGVFAYGISDHLTFQNLTIHDTGISGICAVSTGWSTPQTLTNLTIDGCTLYHTNSTANQEAISLTAVNGFEIKNNTVHDPIDTNRVGIDVKVGSQNGSIHNNEVYSTGAGSNNIYVDAAGAATSNISIYNNNVHSGAGNGIVINDELQRATLTNINIYNNLIWGNLRGFVVNPTGGAAHYNFTFINNTLYNNGAWAEIWINTSHAYLSNSIIRNNIINSLTSGSYGVQYNDYANGGIAVDHNLFYNPGGSWHSGNVLGTGYITANPLLTSPPSNFSLSSNSPAKDVGSTAGAPATDYVGTSRPQGTGYDVGAYESMVSKSTPVFSNLSAPAISYGANLTNLSGTIKSSSLVPSGNISIALNGVIQSAAIDGTGNFSSSFDTSSLATTGSPYTISYAYAGDTNFNGISDNSKTLTVNKITANVALSDLNQTYDGTGKSSIATTSPTGLNVSVTYNGSSSPPSNAGAYNVVAAVVDPDYSGANTGTFTISKAIPSFSNLTAPTITFGSGPTSLGGTLSAGSLIPTGSVSITLNGVTQSATLDIGGNFSASYATSSLAVAGSPYNISYVYAGDANFNAVSDNNKTLSVTGLTATVTLSNLSQTYTGSPRTVTATTNPSPLSTTITYNGSSLPPSNAGTYNVVATVVDPDYSGANTGTFTISKATPSFSNLTAPTITFGSGPTTLGGTLSSGSLVPTGSVSITLNGVTQSAILNGSGNFSASFATSSLAVAGSPYKISFAYPGDVNFNAISDSSKTLTINILAPILSPIGNKSIKQSQLLSFTISASDPNGLPLTYSASNLPLGASFNAVTRTFSWTPTRRQVGSYVNVLFRVSNGVLSSSMGITITVLKY